MNFFLIDKNYETLLPMSVLLKWIFAKKSW